MQKLLFTLSSVLLLASCTAKLQKVDLSHNASTELPYANEIALGAKYTYSNGKVRKSKGYLKGSKSWKHLKVDVRGGTYQGGKVHIDYAKAAGNGDKISIHYAHEKDTAIRGGYDIRI
ncbi:MAG TPA: hypothetical protein VL947_11050, partial [Cytophagales bacterium]|nr:hypothetical protein [Cytophagales bacterium]